MKIYNEIVTKFNDNTGEWETISEDSFDYDGDGPMMLATEWCCDQPNKTCCLLDFGGYECLPANICAVEGIGSQGDAACGCGNGNGGGGNGGGGNGGGEPDEMLWRCTGNAPTHCTLHPAGIYFSESECHAETACGPAIPGCTDPTADNYNPNATVDNGSCIHLDNGNGESTGGDFCCGGTTCPNSPCWSNQGCDQPGAPNACYAVNSMQCTELGASWCGEGGDEYIMGDVTGDGDVNVHDVIALIQMIHNNGGAPFPAANFPQADMNGDGMIDVADVVSLINMILSQPRTSSAGRRKLQIAKNKLNTQRGRRPVLKRPKRRRGGRTRPVPRRMARGGRARRMPHGGQIHGQSVCPAGTFRTADGRCTPMGS